jgi:nucleoside-diphosphate-sugar epimerase
MNILVTGANGFVASNIIKSFELNTSHKIFKITRQSLNLYSQTEVKTFVDENSIDHIIHCAIEGGKRTVNDTEMVLHNNLLMANNLLSCKISGAFINISSGAEFDRRRNIFDIKEYEIYNSFPTDYYGLSKNIISKLVNSTKHGFNLRIFGCFGCDEQPSRMIRANLLNYFNKTPIIIHQDKYMDFVYIKDVCKLVISIIDNNLKTNDVNVVYKEKYKLSDIANIINNIDIHKVPIIVEDTINGLNYCGNGDIFNSLNLNYIGLHHGLQECYRQINF